MRKAFPELLKEHNTTYKQMLISAKEHLTWRVEMHKFGLYYDMHRLSKILKELYRWNKYLKRGGKD